MKRLLLGTFVLLSVSASAQFNYTVKITDLYAEGDDCDGDIAGICTSAPQDPVIHIWVYDDLPTPNAADHCWIYDNDPAMDFGLWNDIQDTALLTVSNSNANVFFFDMEAFESDQFGNSCTYDSGGDDNYFARTQVKFIALGGISTTMPYTDQISIGNSYKANIEIVKESVASVGNHHFGGLSVFPNPADDQLKVSINVSEQVNASVVIRNQMGQEVMRVAQNAFHIGANDLNIDLSDLSAGMYFIAVEGEGSFLQRKFIKQ